MARAKRAPGNEDDGRTLELFFSVYPEATYVGANVAGPRGRGYERRVLSRWRLDTTREDLAGLGSDAVVRYLCVRLVRRLEPGSPEPYHGPLTVPPAEGPGVPLGTTGGIVRGQQVLPGL